MSTCSLISLAIKILSTGMGEATSEYLAHRFNPFLVAAMGAWACWWRSSSTCG
ncbi:MAG: hypothetical protein ACRENY_09715 [Candidatus Dormibacteria bacterium]